MSEIKIPVAYVGRKRYRSEELNDGAPRKAEILAASKARTLTDEDYRQVKAVPAYDCGPPEKRHHVRSHFCLVGQSAGTAVEATEIDPTHEQTLDFLESKLSTFASAFVISTSHPTQKRVVRVPNKAPFSVQVPLEIRRCPSGCSYTWLREPATRHWREDAYIQPDLVGFDANRPWPGPNNPKVIVEVINHHTPEVETWMRLVDLSRQHHLVLFYLCTAKSDRGKFGRTEQKSSPSLPSASRLWVQVEFYLKEGVFYEGANPYAFVNTEAKLQAVEATDHMKKLMNRWMR